MTPLHSTARLIALLTRLESEPGCIALMAEVDLELLAEMDCHSLPPTFPRFARWKYSLNWVRNV